MLEQPQQCPCCEGAIDRRHFAREEFIDHFLTYLFCEFCARGWETLWMQVDGEWREKFTLEYDGRKDPEKLGMMRQRLHDRRAA